MKKVILKRGVVTRSFEGESLYKALSGYSNSASFEGNLVNQIIENAHDEFIRGQCIEDSGQYTRLLKKFYKELATDQSLLIKAIGKWAEKSGWDYLILDNPMRFDEFRLVATNAGNVFLLGNRYCLEVSHCSHNEIYNYLVDYLAGDVEISEGDNDIAHLDALESAKYIADFDDMKVLASVRYGGTLEINSSFYYFFKREFKKIF